MSNKARVSPGVPSGGEFKAVVNGEATGSLTMQHSVRNFEMSEVQVWQDDTGRFRWRVPGNGLDVDNSGHDTFSSEGEAYSAAESSNPHRFESSAERVERASRDEWAAEDAEKARQAELARIRSTLLTPDGGEYSDSMYEAMDLEIDSVKGDLDWWGDDGGGPGNRDELERLHHRLYLAKVSRRHPLNDGVRKATADIYAARVAYRHAVSVSVAAWFRLSNPRLHALDPIRARMANAEADYVAAMDKLGY